MAQQQAASNPASGIPRRYLVTGALGCIGAWVSRVLAEEGSSVIAYDLGDDDHRLRLAVPPDLRTRITRVIGDVTDQPLLERTIAEHGIEAIIHLAGLQVPLCRANPVLGAQVNVIGTLALFEAAKAQLTGNAPIVYASSVAAYDSTDPDKGDSDEVPGRARTHYGVFKRANEGTAFVYWADEGIPSIGLRPHVVYGPGRDQGLTSDPTLAMLAAARGQGYHIRFGGGCQMQYVEDVARNFISATRSPFRGARVVNLAGSAVHMRDIITAVEATAPDVSGQITYDDTALPFPAQVTAHNGELFAVPAETSLLEGVQKTIARFKSYATEANTVSGA